MSSEDNEVRLMAARAIEFLSTHPSNKSIVARSPGLVTKMVWTEMELWELERVRWFWKRARARHFSSNII